MNDIVTVVTSTRKKDDNLIREIKKGFSHPKTQILIYENDNQMSLAEVYNKGLEEREIGAKHTTKELSDGEFDPFNDPTYIVDEVINILL